MANTDPASHDGLETIPQRTASFGFDIIVRSATADQITRRLFVPLANLKLPPAEAGAHEGVLCSVGGLGYEDLERCLEARQAKPASPLG